MNSLHLNLNTIESQLSCHNFAEALDSLREFEVNIPKEKYQSCILRGKALEALGSLFCAVLSFEEAIQIDPCHIEPYLKKISLLEKINIKEEIMKGLEIILKLDPSYKGLKLAESAENNELHLKKSLSFLAGEYSEYNKKLESLSQKLPDYIHFIKARETKLNDMESLKSSLGKKDFNYFSGMIHFERQEYALAIDCFTNVLKEDDSHKDSLYKLGISLIHYKIDVKDSKSKGKFPFSSPIKCFERYLQIDPDDKMANFYLGLLYAQVKEKKAPVFLEKVLIKDPNFEVGYMELAYLVKDKQPNSALSLLDKACSINKKNTAALFAKGVLQRSLKKEKEALAVFNAIIKIDPSHEDSYFERNEIIKIENPNKILTEVHEFSKNYKFIKQKANLLKNLNRTEEYFRFIQRYLQNYEDLDFLIEMVVNYSEKLDPRKTEDYLQRMIICHPNKAEAYKLQGVCYFNLNNYDYSYYSYSLAKSIDENILEESDFFNMAINSYILKQFPEALEYAENAIKANKNVSKYHDLKACISKELGNLEKALESSNMAIKLDPDVAVYYCHKADVLIKQRLHKEASQAIEKAHSLDKDNIEVILGMGKIKAVLREFPSALLHLDTVLRDDECNEEALVYKGEILMETKKYDEAIDIFNTLKNINSSLPQIYSNLGQANFHKKLYKESLAQFDQLIKIDPTNFYSGTIWKLRTLIFSDRLEEAEIFLQSIYENTFEKDEAILLLRGELAYRKKHYDEAVLIYDKISELNPQNSDVLISKGKVLLEMSMKNAVELFSRALRINSEANIGDLPGNLIFSQQSSTINWLNNEKKCSICLVNNPDYAYLPCGHKVLCEDCQDHCSKSSKTCCLCRKPFICIVKIFE